MTFFIQYAEGGHLTSSNF